MYFLNSRYMNYLELQLYLIIFLFYTMCFIFKRKGDIMETLGDRIKKIAKKKKLTYREIAKDTSLSLNTISKIVNNQTQSISSETLKIFCDKLEVSSDYLLGLDEEPSRDFDSKKISKELGLSLKSIQKIKRLKTREEIANKREQEKRDDLNKSPIRTISSISDDIHLLGHPLTSLDKLLKDDFINIDELLISIVEYLYFDKDSLNFGNIAIINTDNLFKDEEDGTIYMNDKCNIVRMTSPTIYEELLLSRIEQNLIETKEISKFMKKERLYIENTENQ